MRSYDETDKYDQENVERLKAPAWMLAQLALNPSYVHWGPHEDYMWKKGDGWDSPILHENWSEGKLGLDELNEVANFYFEIARDSKECETCGGDGYHPDAHWISESFYSHSSPFKVPNESERRAMAVMDQFNEGQSSRRVLNSFFPSTALIEKYGIPFFEFCQETQQRGGSWNDAITEDEAAVLVEAGRGRHDNLTTAADFNAAQGKDGLMGHDAINRSFLIEQRCKRLGVPKTCPTCDGHGYVYTADECRLGLILWVLHPRKGCSRGWEIKNIQQSELSDVYAFLAEAAERNQQRFHAVIARTFEDTP
jgi:hypothetical protein